MIDSIYPTPGHSGQHLPLSSQFMSNEYDKIVNTDQGNSIIYSTAHYNLHNYQLNVRGAVRVEIGLAARRSKIGTQQLQQLIFKVGDIRRATV